MSTAERSQVLTGLRVTSLGTLAGRLLGMVRDMATAALLGLSGDGVMDAFVIAFRIPNLFRRLFGEGALTASYLPVFSARLQRGRTQAWQLTSVTLVWLAAVLAALVVLAEAACGLVWWLYADVPGMTLLVGLTAAMLPYLFFICLAAQVSGTLHALGHFSAPALAPTVLNICWLVGVCLIAPRMTLDKEAQAYILAVSVLVAGVLQLGVQIPALRSLGFHFDYNWPASRDALGQIVASLGPMVLGLAVMHINSFFDSLMAWFLAAPAGGSQRIAWLGGAVAYPLRQGAAAAIYYGERLYQLPLGLLGMAVATVIFPLLSRHAARGEHARLAADLSLGLRLVLFLGIPAGAGLVLLSDPLATLLFARGEFTADDASRVARMISCYGLGVWAFCALPVIVRGFYALGDQRAPLRAGAVAMFVNISLNLLLVWPLAEVGLALATSLASVLQLALLGVQFSRRWGNLHGREIARTVARTSLATACMLLGGYAALAWFPSEPGTVPRMLRVGVPLVVGAAIFFGVSRKLRIAELELLLGRKAVKRVEGL